MLNEFLDQHKNNANQDIWEEMINDYKNERHQFIEYGAHIEKGMIEYLKKIGDTEDFKLIFDNPLNGIDLQCKGDLFDLEQIGGFCDVFGLELIINNRLVVENYLEDTTTITTRYLFKILDKKEVMAHV